MFGMPTETADEAWETVKMIKKIRPYRSSAAFFTPFPGSFLYDYCRENNLSLIDEHDGFVRFPEVDKPKIKNIDYELLRRMARISKNVSAWTKLRIRVERIFAHKKSKAFKVKFLEEAKQRPVKGMAVLRLARAEAKII